MNSVLELRHSYSSRLMTLLLSLVAASTLLGCTRANLYQASSLPPELMAPRHATLQNVDLSRLARTISNSQVLYTGDEVEITIATGVEDKAPPAWKGRVAEDGSITIPLVGTVQVAGMEMIQAEQLIRAESIRRGKYVSPNVALTLTQRRTNRVAVLGAVEEPNTYELPASSSDLLTAVIQAGGLSENAGTIIEIRHPPGLAEAPISNGGDGYSTDLASTRGRRRLVRTPPRTLQVDLTEATNSDFGDYSLPDGATVMVMERPKRFIHVMGLVNKSDQFEIPEEIEEPRLLDALAMAGGRKLSIADKVHVIRQLPDRSDPVVIEASVRAAKADTTSNIRLTSGDVVSVEETPTTFVVGTIRDFVRFGFSSAIPGF
ncbi:MAG: polysaccharide biosynthesis/export family protein [Planctomycetes bacterium]|nr:polysaccharide biosynthesis/export family protein [Planctomycetota bacterium]